MDKFEAIIRRAIAEDRWTFTRHAEERLEERQIEGWQIVDGIDEAVVMTVEPRALPNAKLIVRQLLPDGTPIVAVWAFIKSINSAALITVYFEE